MLEKPQFTYKNLKEIVRDKPIHKEIHHNKE